MKRRDFIKTTTGVLAATMMPLTVKCVTSTIKRKPNVLLIMTDDQGWGDVHSYGNEKIDTPVMDKLAEDGVRFERFFVSPVCAPTRANLLTGRYHLRTGCSWVPR